MARPKLEKCRMNPDTDPDPAFQVNPDPIGIHFMTKNKRNKIQQKILYFFDQTLQFTFVQATGEALSQKRTSNTLKNEIYQLFSMFVCHFGPLGSRSGSRIRIQGSR
jgi:hypothetical protein